MRVDKWIWTTWMTKSRTQAGEFCRAGRVLINGKKSKPAKLIKIGDEISVEFPAGTKKYRVLQFLDKRGKETMAEGCFENLSPGFAEMVAEHKKVSSAQNRDTRKVKFRYGDGRESKKDKRARSAFQNK
jgi:ribosome-associated heat shock protein Hsp15